MTRSHDLQTQMAEYYTGQLNLHAKQCFGRSYNCIAWMETFFSYELLCSMAYNLHLPAKVRSAAVAFVQALYLDRNPQQINCGKVYRQHPKIIETRNMSTKAALNERDRRAREHSGF